MITQHEAAAGSLWALPPESERGARRLIARWRAQAESAGEPTPTRLTRRDYLDTIEKIVGFFAEHQIGTGAIVDPYRKAEFQYSTPCFAYAAALLVSARGRSDLLDSACRAMDRAVHGLTTRTAPDAHEDFYASPLAHALRLLERLAGQQRVEAWRETLRRMDPFATYRRAVGAQGPSANWNCIAAAGEYLLHRLGVRDDPAFAERSLAAQGALFGNEFGMYAEGPMAYDAFARAWLGDMLSRGYAGPGAREIEEMFDRGSLTSLLLQSPTGELPCGGRSAHHQWADLLQTLIFEAAAGRARRTGDRFLAGVFKRAARRAYGAILPWQRPSGELWVIKNKADPALRHGYEAYTAHSQYNLLAAAALGYAYELAAASETLPERITPAETGGFVLALPAPFYKLVAAAGGAQVIVCSRPDPKQTPAGLIRVHFAGLPSPMGPSDGLLRETAYALPPGPRSDLAIGLAWPAAQGRITGLAGGPLNSLAGMPPERVSATAIIAREEPGDLRFRVEYRLVGEALPRILETYEIAAGAVTVAYDTPGARMPTLLRWPVFASDGSQSASISLGPDRVAVAYGGRRIQYLLEGAGPLRISPQSYPHRNGHVRIAEAEKPIGTTLRLSIRCGEPRI